MITSQRAELPNGIKDDYVTWTRLWLFARNLRQQRLLMLRHLADCARIVSIPKGKVGFVERMLALAVTKLYTERPAWSNVPKLAIALLRYWHEDYRIFALNQERSLRKISWN
jgi:hypothetical protein